MLPLSLKTPEDIQCGRSVFDRPRLSRGIDVIGESLQAGLVRGSDNEVEN